MVTQIDCFFMKNKCTLKTARRISSLIYIITLLAFIFAFVSGCRPSKPSPGPAALSLKARVQTNLALYLPELSESIDKKKRKQVKATLDSFYAQLNGPGVSSPFSLALLDSHGVTITSRSQKSLSGNQNYGHYQVVSNVLQKNRTFTSSLYLQGGDKVYIICVPLLGSEKLTGVLVIGIDSKFMRKSGITEAQFLSLDFNSHVNGTP